MVKVKIYIEGAGPGPEQSTEFRQAWREFFVKSGLERLPAVVRGQSREKTWDLFQTAVRARKKDELPILLVDSETAVQSGHSAWLHLAKENWKRPDGAGENDAFLMVQTMETWILAGLEPESRWPELELVEKEKIFLALKAATGNRYRKGRVSFAFLEKVDHAAVKRKCAWAERLLDRLKELQ